MLNSKHLSLSCFFIGTSSILGATALYFSLSSVLTPYLDKAPVDHGKAEEQINKVQSGKIILGKNKQAALMNSILELDKSSILFLTGIKKAFLITISVMALLGLVIIFLSFRTFNLTKKKP